VDQEAEGEARLESQEQIAAIMKEEEETRTVEILEIPAMKGDVEGHANEEEENCGILFRAVEEIEIEIEMEDPVQGIHLPS